MKMKIDLSLDFKDGSSLVWEGVDGPILPFRLHLGEYVLVDLKLLPELKEYNIESFHGQVNYISWSRDTGHWRPYVGLAEDEVIYLTKEVEDGPQSPAKAG